MKNTIKLQIATALATAALVTSAAAETKLREVKISADSSRPMPTIIVENKNGLYNKVQNKQAIFWLKTHGKINNASLRYKIYSSLVYVDITKYSGGGRPAYVPNLKAYEVPPGDVPLRKVNATNSYYFWPQQLGQYSQKAIDRCNDLAASYGPADKDRTATINVGVGLFMRAGKMPISFGQGHHPEYSHSKAKERTHGFAQTWMLVKLVCKKDTTPLKVTAVNLSYSASGKSCPKSLTIFKEIESNRPGKVTYRRERKGGQPSGWITVNTKKSGNRFIYTKKETQEVGHVDQTRRIKIKNGPASQWVKVEVDCEKFKVLSAKYSYSLAKGNSCPRNITINTVFETNQKGFVTYRRERKGGQPSAWLKVQSNKVGNKYLAKITETQKVGDLDQIRRVNAKNGPASNWVHFKNDCSPMKVTKVQLGIKISNGNSCKKTATFTAWVFGNKEGWAKVRYRQAGGGKSAWYLVKLKKGAKGVYLGSHTETKTYTKPASTKFMAEVKGHPKISNWVSVNIKCKSGPSDLKVNNKNEEKASNTKVKKLGKKFRIGAKKQTPRRFVRKR